MRRDAARNRLSRRFVVAAALVVLASVLTDGGFDDGVICSYRVAAFDAAGNASPISAPAAVTTPDVTVPSVPLDLRAVSTSQNVALTWRASTDNVGVTNYVVFRDGLPLVTLGGTALGHTDSALVGPRSTVIRSSPGRDGQRERPEQRGGTGS